MNYKEWLVKQSMEKAVQSLSKEANCPSLKALFPSLDGKWAHVNLEEEFAKTKYDLKDPKQFNALLDELKKKHGADFLAGGLHEDRERMVRNFDPSEISAGNFVHLGTDNWAPAGTEVAIPFDGEVVHVFKDDDQSGGWGGRIIWKLPSGDYLLYGHLAYDIPVKVGDKSKAGDIVGRVGETSMNGGSPPHLHVQVMTEEEVAPYKDNLEKIDGYGPRK